MYSSGWEMVSFYSFDLHFSQFSSVTQSCPTLRSHGLQHTRPPCHHQLPESTQTHAHWVGDAIQPSHPLLSLSPPAITLSQHIMLFSNESVLRIRWPKYWSCSFNISPSNEYSRLISFRMDWLALLAVQGTLKSLLQHHIKSINPSALSFLYCPTLTLIHDYWKKHSLD